MKNKVWLLLALVAIVAAFFGGKGCSAPAITAINTVHERYDSIIYKERIVVDSIPIPGERILIRIPVNCPDGQKPIPTQTSGSTKHANVTASIDSSGILNIESNCDSLYQIIINKEKESQHNIKVLDSTNKVAVIKEKYIPRRYKIAMGVALAETTFFIYKIINILKP